jgi:hypothetical protein
MPQAQPAPNPFAATEQAIEVRVLDGAHTSHAAWLGGSLLASSSSACDSTCVEWDAGRCSGPTAHHDTAPTGCAATAPLMASGAAHARARTPATGMPPLAAGEGMSAVNAQAFAAMSTSREHWLEHGSLAPA